MKRKFASLLFVLVAMVAGTGIAQQPAASPGTPPDPPYVAALPNRCAWTLTLPEPGPDAGPAASGSAKASPSRRGRGKPRLVQIENVQTEDKRAVGLLDSNGQRTTCFHIGGFTLYKDPSSGAALLVESHPVTPVYDYFGLTFYGVEHIQGGDFQGEVIVKGVRCHHYKGRFANMDPDSPVKDADSSEEYEAWINAETRLPVAYREGKQVMRYTFTEPPTTDLAIPTEFRKVWSARQHDLEQLQRMQRP